MKRKIQAATTDRLFHAIDRTLVAPLRARLDTEVAELRDRALAAERAVHDLAESLEPRVAALEAVVFAGEDAGTLPDAVRRIDRRTDELGERVAALAAEAGAGGAALADLADRIGRLEAGATERSG